jgi:hypothetical protein
MGRKNQNVLHQFDFALQHGGRETFPVPVPNGQPRARAGLAEQTRPVGRYNGVILLISKILGWMASKMVKN